MHRRKEKQKTKENPEQTKAKQLEAVLSWQHGSSLGVQARRTIERTAAEAFNGAFTTDQETKWFLDKPVEKADVFAPVLEKITKALQKVCIHRWVDYNLRCEKCGFTHEKVVDDKLNINPDVLLVPKSLEQQAQRVLYGGNRAGKTTAKMQNGSTIAWYDEAEDIPKGQMVKWFTDINTNSWKDWRWGYGTTAK